MRSGKSHITYRMMQMYATNPLVYRGSNIATIINDYLTRNPPGPEEWAVWLACKAWLLDQGYRRISRRNGGLSRLDREDWLPECMMFLKHPYEVPGFDYEDFYRRVLSKDKIEVIRYVSEMIPNSSGERTGFIAMTETPEHVSNLIENTRQRRRR